MANSNVARGLQPVRHRNGAPWAGAATKYYVPASDATALYIGDPVVVVTDASDSKGTPTVTKATAGATNYITGVVIGFITAGDPPVVRSRDAGVHRAALTEAYVLVADDPDLVFEMQEDSVGGVMTVGAAGRNADFVDGSGSAYTGMSGVSLDSSTLGTGNTKQLRIIAPVDRPDNDPTLDYAKWLVSINLHTQRNLTGI